jgi:site-specific DNA-methyltransferase (adenine-specific)
MMLKSKNISIVVDYPKSRDCFPGVDIAGGVCYFLWDSMYSGKCKLVSRQGHSEITRDRDLNEFSIFIRDNIGIDIIHKVLKSPKDYMDSVVYSRNPFGFVSSDRGNKTEFHGAVKLHSSEGVGYVTRQAILKNADLLDDYKVIIGKVNPDRGGVNNASDGKMNVITKVRILKPNEVMTETYLLLATFKEKTQAENCATYYRTKFARLLISLTLSSMNITKDNFQFLPNQDFSKSWTDEELYAKYDFSDEEIAFIESMIRPME